MSQVFYAESRSMLEPLVVYAYPRHPEDGSQVLVGDLDTIDVLVFQGGADPIWQVLGADPADYLVDVPVTTDGFERTFSFSLNYGGAYQPVGGRSVLWYAILRRADVDDEARGVLELTASIPLRDSAAARVLGFE